MEIYLNVSGTAIDPAVPEEVLAGVPASFPSSIASVSATGMDVLTKDVSGDGNAYAASFDLGASCEIHVLSSKIANGLTRNLCYVKGSPQERQD